MLSKTKKILILSLVILTFSHNCLADALIIPKEKPNLSKEVIKKKISKGILIPPIKPSAVKKEKTVEVVVKKKLDKINGIIIPKSKPLFVKKEKKKKVATSKYFSKKDFEYAKELDLNIKLLAFAEKEGSTIFAKVHPILIPINDPMAKVDRNYNVIEIEGDLIGKLWIQGEGAGNNSTTSAVLGDLMSLFDSRQSDMLFLNQNLKIRTIDQDINKYYLRLVVVDQPGVLAQIAEIFSKNKISIASVIQKDLYPDNQFVDLVIMTHSSIEKNIQDVVKSISLLKVVQQDPLLIRVQN